MYFIDVQGTLIRDSDKMPIEGSIEFIDRLNREKIPYMIITNNTKKESLVFYEYLQNLGFNFSYDKYLDPLRVLTQTVAKECIAAYGTEEFLQIIQNMGYVLDYTQPKQVLISIKENYSAQEYAQIIEFLLQGASLVGMHETSLYAKNGQRYPGVGAILKLLEFATSSAYKVVGKPNISFYETALTALQKQLSSAKFSEITIISDDVKGDLGGAKILGMKTIFVTSGKYKSAQEIVPLLDERLQPDEIFANMQEIMEKI